MQITKEEEEEEEEGVCWRHTCFALAWREPHVATVTKSEKRDSWSKALVIQGELLHDPE